MWRLQGKIKKFQGEDALQPDLKDGMLGADHSHAGTGAVVTVTIWERPDNLPEFKFDPKKEGQVCDRVIEKIMKQREIAEKQTGIRFNVGKNMPKGTDLLSPHDKDLKFRYKNNAGATIIHNHYEIDY